ncbi:polysaccharide deacetylase family protein [Pseudomonas sp. MAP12]|uniref:Polysaccharide deacetylase family protein n=1 Tax=Geopseudomonas aromaticivorans TaxID=2849492 RepID=A0ABS6MVX8_9GAMM|nr:polysaccharide deacetylase family protein [Pseudomonas aromaticivorans]MBV2132968.1 polysaccharide deacetylase family protein [Pseudomonas aromaticivorans]
MPHGIFTVSLDFELYWGVRDKRSIEQYRHNLLGVRQAVPAMLQVFRDHDVHATWATVGFLFFDSRESLMQNLPRLLPSYAQTVLSPYPYIQSSDCLEATYHFAPDLLDMIEACAGQEIGTHTFSHYYCLEQGQTLEQFAADISAAVATARARGLRMDSIVFPRNQWSRDYLATLSQLGIRCFRGNERSWIYQARADAQETRLQRALRLLDAYLNLSGHNTYRIAECLREQPFNFPASRFLRPYSKSLARFEWLRLRRIKAAMSDAAIHGKLFHLWWHPHNFGTNTFQNIHFLTRIAEHYRDLNRRYGMRSLNMGEICRLGNS